MIKGMGIVFVIIYHMRTMSGVFKEHATFYNVIGSMALPIMLLFFILSGYTASVKEEGIPGMLIARARRILIPYYKYAVAILVIHAIIYLGIERRSLAWFADGTLGVLFQLQSFHFFDTSSTGVHPMFYVVLIGWFMFQMAVSQVLLIPILYKLKGKKTVWKVSTAIMLLILGAVFYKLNLQHLNGEFFPPVCKIFILPNIPGIAGLMLISNALADIRLLEFDLYSKTQKAIAVLACLAVIVIFIIMDDYRYDFPIGKWGAFGVYSYLLSPIYGIAFVLLVGIICNCLKSVSPVRRFLIHMGDNSLDFVMLHFPVGFLVAYIGGFWYEYLSSPVPTDDLRVNYLHFMILLVCVFAISLGIIRIKTNRRS